LTLGHCVTCGRAGRAGKLSLRPVPRRPVGIVFPQHRENVTIGQRIAPAPDDGEQFLVGAKGLAGDHPEGYAHLFRKDGGKAVGAINCNQRALAAKSKP
jgi:hypothetical protein